MAADLLDDLATYGVNPLFVRGDDKRRHPAVGRHEVATQQRVVQGVPPHRGGAAFGVETIADKRRDLDATIVAVLWRQLAHDTLAVARLCTRSTSGSRAMSREIAVEVARGRRA